MPNRVCAKCGQPARLLEVSSDAIVDYFRCDACGDVWVHDRDSHSPPRPITFAEPPNSANADSQPPTASRRQPSRERATASWKSTPLEIERPLYVALRPWVLVAAAIVGVAIGAFLDGGRDSAFFAACAGCVGVAVALELYFAIGGPC
jgi:hypothetical protein